MDYKQYKAQLITNELSAVLNHFGDLYQVEHITLKDYDQVSKLILELTMFKIKLLGESKPEQVEHTL